MRARVAGIEGDGPHEVAIGAGKVPVEAEAYHASSGVAFRQLGIEFQRAVGGHPRLLQEIGGRLRLPVRTAEQATAVGQSGVRARVLCVKRGGLFEHRDAVAHVRLGCPLAIGTALEGPLVGGKVRRSTSRADHDRREHATAQRLRDAPGHVTLQHQHVVEVALVCLGPQLRLTPHIQQFGRDAHARGIAANAALEQVVDATFLPYLDHVLARRLVLHRGGVGDYAQAPGVQRAELRDHLVGHAVAEELVVRAAAAIFERQHDEHRLARRIWPQPTASQPQAGSRDQECDNRNCEPAAGSPRPTSRGRRHASQSRPPPARGRWCRSPQAPIRAWRVTPGRGWPGHSRCASRCCAGAGCARVPTTRTCPRDRD